MIVPMTQNAIGRVAEIVATTFRLPFPLNTAYLSRMEIGMTPFWIGLFLLLIAVPAEFAPAPDVPWWVFGISIALTTLVTALHYWNHRPWSEAREQAYRSQLAYNNALIEQRQSDFTP